MIVQAYRKQSRYNAASYQLLWGNQGYKINIKFQLSTTDNEPLNTHIERNRSIKFKFSCIFVGFVAFIKQSKYFTFMQTFQKIIKGQNINSVKVVSALAGINARHLVDIDIFMGAQ